MRAKHLHFARNHIFISIREAF